MLTTAQRTNESSAIHRGQSRRKDFAIWGHRQGGSQRTKNRRYRKIVAGLRRRGRTPTGIPNHLFVFGSTGSGKTLMVRHIGNLLATRDGTTVR